MMIEPSSRKPVRIGRYDIRGVLGEGGNGVVYLGFDERLEREVAIKVMSPERASDEDVQARFRREAKAIAKLHHPNILELYDYSGEDSAVSYLVVERLLGQNLDAFVRRHQMPIGAAEACAAGHEICQALAHAHERGIIHRDLKPENVFLEPQGRIVLCDFGIAKALGPQSGTVSGHQTQLVGSPLYMSPEQISMPDKVGPQSDLFSLGSLLYFLVTRKHAFHDQTIVGVLKRVVAGEHPAVEDARPDLDRGVAAVIEKLLAVDLSVRFASAHDAGEALLENLQKIAERPQDRDPRRVLGQLSARARAARTEASAEASESSGPTTAIFASSDTTRITSQTTTDLPDVAENEVINTTQILPQQEAPQVAAHTASAVTATSRQINRRGPVPPQRGKLPLYIASAVVVMLAGLTIWLLIDLERRSPPRVVTVVPAIEAPAAALPLAPPPAPTPTQEREAAVAQPAPPHHTPPAEAPSEAREAAVDPSPSAKREPALLKRSKSAEAAGEGTLRLIALPWAEVYIDDEEVGTTPGFRTKELAPGRHHLKLMNPNFKPREVWFQIRAGAVTKMNFDLEAD